MLQAELIPTPFLRDKWAGMVPIEKFDKGNLNIDSKRDFCSNY